MNVLHIQLFRIALMLLGICAASAVCGGRSPAAELPAGFVEETLVSGINAATALAAAPDGRLFIAEQTGALRVWKDGLLPTPALDLSERVDTYWERGLIGVTLHPEFPRTPHLFVLYVARSPFPHHVLSRFTVSGDTADLSSERVLLEGDDQSKTGGKLPGGHQGGPLRFGADGKLYIAIGEQTARQPSQSLNALQGKVLRIDSDGSIPEDNPFTAQAVGKYRSIWALGLRNPFGLAVQPGTGRIFATDVGESSFEEVNEIVAGANYGWPDAEGFSTDQRFKNPLHAYPPVIGRSICGGTFYPTAANATHSASFPDKWRGKFFFVDWAAHWVRALDPNSPDNVATFARGFNGPVAVEVAFDGSLLVLNRGTIWRDGKSFAAKTGSLVRIRYTGASGELTQHRDVLPMPESLSATGLFESLFPFTPGRNFVPFEINAPPWQPGVHALRWISIPSGKRIGFSADGEWEFPSGAIVAQHYVLDSPNQGAPFETHVLWLNGARTARAAAYRWAADGRDARLMIEPEIVPLPGNPKCRWFSPGAEENLNLDTVVTGFVLPVNTRQLNREIVHAQTAQPTAQLKLWNERGWFEPRLTDNALTELPRLASPDNVTASAELRVRSYLDVNCAACHHPGGPARASIDARFATPLREQNLLNGELIAGDLGIAGAKVIAAGAPEKSLLYQRVKRNDFFRMPPFSVNDAPQPVLPVLEQWIRSLK